MFHMEMNVLAKLPPSQIRGNPVPIPIVRQTQTTKGA